MTTRWMVAFGAMGRELIMFPSLLLCQYLSSLECGKELAVGQVILQLAVKRFNIPILPGTASFSKERFYSYSVQPLRY